MSKSQINYSNDNTVGKRTVCGSLGLKNKIYERVKTFDYETVEVGNYTVDPTTPNNTEDQLGIGDGALNVYYLSTVVSSANVYLYKADDEYETNITPLTLNGGVPGGFIVAAAYPNAIAESFNPNTGKLVLEAAAIMEINNKYLFASYKYLLPKGDFEIERQIIDHSIYLQNEGSMIHVRHCVGEPNSEFDGNYRFDKSGEIADGTASRMGDVYVVTDRINNTTFVAYGGNNDLTDTNFFREVVPIADSVIASGENYVKDASLYEGDVVTDVVTVVSSAMVLGKLQYTITLTNNVFADHDLLLSFPYNAYLVCSDKSLAIPISDNVIVGGIDTIKIVPGFGGSTLANADVIYIRVNIPGGFMIRNSAL